MILCRMALRLSDLLAIRKNVMLTYLDQDKLAKEVALYYARQLKNDTAQKFYAGSLTIESKEQAENITRFYWEMVDQAVADNDDGVPVEGVTDLAYWMETLLNITMGYLKKVGMADVWNTVSDEINGR